MAKIFFFPIFFKNILRVEVLEKKQYLQYGGHGGFIWEEMTLGSSHQMTRPFGQELSLDEIPETPGCQPFALHRDQAQCKEEDESLKKLNDFLVSREYSPVRHRVRGMLSEAAERTKREYLRKVRQGIVAVVETIVPGQKDETWAELTRSGVLDAQFNARKMGRVHIEADHSIHALVAAYRQSEARVTKLQILSIVVDIFPQRQIQDLLPEVTKYQLFQAKKTFNFVWKRVTLTSCC